AGFSLAWLIFGSLHFKSQLQVRKLNKKLKKSTTETSPIQSKV
ncbi:DUF1049 domain-containing protein, partial [Vibrio genomosp. F10]